MNYTKADEREASNKKNMKPKMLKARDWISLCSPQIVIHRGVHLMFNGKTVVPSKDGRIRIFSGKGKSYYLDMPRGFKQIWANKIAARDKWRKSIVGGFKG